MTGNLVIVFFPLGTRENLQHEKWFLKSGVSLRSSVIKKKKCAYTYEYMYKEEEERRKKKPSWISASIAREEDTSSLHSQVYGIFLCIHNVI